MTSNRIMNVFKTFHGEYHVIRQLGEGGSGSIVYEVEAQETEHCNTGRYALKYLCKLERNEQNETQFKRFENEILFAAENGHDYLLQAVDDGAVIIDGKCYPFYVMSLYPKTLKDLINQGIPHEKILTYFHQLLDGTERLAEEDFIHRDLKPANIFYDEEGDKLIIADFGITDFTANPDYTLVETEVGVRLMSARYGSPEQVHLGYKPHPIMGGSGQIDHRADIYALGLILHEMYTNVNYTSADSYRSIIDYLINQEFERIGERSMPSYKNPMDLIEELHMLHSVRDLDIDTWAWAKNLEETYGYIDDLIERMTETNIHRRVSEIRFVRVLLEQKGKEEEE